MQLSIWHFKEKGVVDLQEHHPPFGMRSQVRVNMNHCQLNEISLCSLQRRVDREALSLRP